MRKLILTALLAATAALPTMASAQTAELRHDRRDIRQETRDLRQAYRYGDRDDIRDERRDLRSAHREYREDWQDYRRDHRNEYRRGNWRAPFAYQRFHEGAVMRPAYYSSRYYVAPARYRLPPAYGATRWVRHYDDALLVNVRTGRVVRVIDRFWW